ncbi:MAG: cytidylate kinase-like family protein, partial [Ruminococcaceae bacterium]|nr:cytidylate kinase-like family protein [Oscillospiraceae bacterium]
MKGVITIGRELGSGGRTIGRAVAEKLGVPYYDRELIDEAAKQSGLSPDFIEKSEQAVTGSFLYNIAMGNSYSYGMLGLAGTNSLPLTMQVFIAQQKVILEYAKNPCVIVGRCSDYILRERED